MPANMRIHLAAAGLLFVLVSVIALFWSFPKLLVYALLALVAALAYGALYLILAAWMDPKDKESAPEVVTSPPPAPVDDTLPDATVPDIPLPAARKPRKKKSAKKKKTAKKKATRKKKTE